MEVQQVSWNTWLKEKGKHSAVRFTPLPLDTFAVMSAHLFVLYRRPNGEKRQLLLDSLLERMQVLTYIQALILLCTFSNATE